MKAATVCMHSRRVVSCPVQPRACHWICVFWRKFSGVKRACWTTGSWRSCLSLEVVSSIPAGSTIIYRFLCGFICVSLCQSIKIKPTNMLIRIYSILLDDVINWKQFPRYLPFVRGIHQSPGNSPHKGQWRGALMFSLISGWWFETPSRPLWRHCNKLVDKIFWNLESQIICTILFSRNGQLNCYYKDNFSELNLNSCHAKWHFRAKHAQK